MLQNGTTGRWPLARPRRSGEGVEAVDRALAILRAFDAEAPALRLADLAARTGFYKSTALRLLASLQRHGFVVRGEDGLYRIGEEARRVGALFLHELRITERLPPIMRRLSEETGESVSFYVPRLDLDPAVRVCVLRVDAPRSVRDHLAVGDRLPFDRGSTGRLMRAFASPTAGPDAGIRAARVHASWGDRDPEICGISAAVAGPHGEFVGALTLSAPTSRRDRAWTEAMKPVVLAAADEASRALGYRPGAPAAGAHRRRAR